MNFDMEQSMQTQSKREAGQITKAEWPSHRWAVILAGGEGKRLLPLTRQITGDERPKQFCRVIGDETLLHQTRRRVSRMIMPRQTLLVMTAAHECYYADQVAGVPPPSLVIQPKNKGTAAAVVYSLMRLRHISPRAVVAFFPSDHHFSNEEALVAHMEVAFHAAEGHPKQVILLGIVPERPEASYGWIEPGTTLANLPVGMISQVRRFWEKPAEAHAAALMRSGCLWNSFVMVGAVDGFLDLVRRTVPDLIESFETIRPALLTPQEPDAVGKVYSGLRQISFCDAVLSASSTDLAVVRGSGLGWSDVGEPERVFSVLRRKGVESSWDFRQSEGWTAAASGPR
jgi:mannose-1-phosphate guanylyltransferase